MSDDDLGDEILVYPEGRVVGVIGDADRVGPAIDALADAGSDRDEVIVYHGGDDAERLETDTDEKGPLASVVRKVQKAFGDEAERLASLNAALEAGDHVVTVPLTADDDDEDAQVAERERVAQVLQDHGARDLAYYGRWAIVQLEAGAS